MSPMTNPTPTPHGMSSPMWEEDSDFIDAPELNGGNVGIPGFPEHVDTADYVPKKAESSLSFIDAPELAGTAADPLTSLPDAPVVSQEMIYKVVGTLSSQQVISGAAERYAHLDPIILEVTSHVQQQLVALGKEDETDNARKNPGERQEIAEEIDRIALAYMLRERKVRGDDGKIVIASVVNDIIGLGPLEPLWQDPNITEVIVNGPNDVYVEQKGKLVKAKACRFRSQEHLLEVCQRILAPLNRKVDVRDPLADGRLPDGSRVNVVHTCIAPKGPLLTIRRFPETTRSMVDLVSIGSMDKDMATLLATLVANRTSILVVGATGTGKSLWVDTPIPLASGGFKKMGDIVVGDIVLDETMSPTVVTGAFDVMENHPCYNVQFSDGSSIIADAEHLWRVRDIQYPAHNDTIDWWVLTTEQLAGFDISNSRYVVPAVTGGRHDSQDIDKPERSFVRVRPVVSVPVRCIRVDSPHHVFLAGESYIPTHNTTFLNALSEMVSPAERIITIEDSLELRMNPRNHVAAMEARPPDATGGNAVTIRMLVKNALRMKPTRIIVGEIRDSAALDMLQACNTGHEGSMSTLHANGPDEAISRLAVMVAQGGEMPGNTVEWLVGSAIDMVVMVTQYADGSRRVSGLYEVPDTSQLSVGEPLRTIPLWEWKQTGVEADGKIVGEYVKLADISNHLYEAKRLEFGVKYSWDDLLTLSAGDAPTAPAKESSSSRKPGKPQRPGNPAISRPSVFGAASFPASEDDGSVTL